MFRLDALDRAALHGPRGPIALTDPRHVALLVRLAGAPNRVLPTDDILLQIWPHLSLNQGRDQLRNAASGIAKAAGVSMVTETPAGWTLSGDVQCDFDQARPTDAGSFLRGFELPDTPEWDSWVATVRQEIAFRPGPSRRPRVARRFVALPAAAIILASGYVATRPRVIAGFNPGDRVILADVENRISDSTMGRALLFAAVVGLQQSSRIELHPRERVLATLGSMGRISKPGGLTRDLAIEVASRSGVPWVVALEATPDRDRTTIRTRLIRVATREIVLTTTGTAADQLNLVAAVDKTLRGLQRRIGESGRRLRDQPELAFATTSDYEALRAYTDGAEAWRRGEWRMARDYWDRALSLDTGFAMAMGSLGAFHYYSHNRSDGERYYRQALARTGRLTEWERLHIEGRYASYRGDLDSALVVNRRVAAAFPRADSYYDLGTALLQRDQCREGLEWLERARELDPASVKTYLNIATCHNKLYQYEEARLAYRAADRLDSTVLYQGNVNLEYADVLVHTGRVVEAESALARMATRPTMTDEALGFRGLGYLALWRGQVARARDHFRRAAGMSRQQGAANSLLRNLALFAVADGAAGDRVGLRRTLAPIDSLAALQSLAPTFLTLAVEPLAEEADVARLRLLLDHMRRRADPRRREDSLHIRTSPARWLRSRGTRGPRWRRSTERKGSVSRRRLPSVAPRHRSSSAGSTALGSRSAHSSPIRCSATRTRPPGPGH